MKLIMPMLLIAFLSVSCGNKNSSGGGGSNDNASWDTLEDDVYSNSSYQAEEKIKSTYIKALKDTFNKNKSKIKKSVGQANYNLIQSRISNLQVTAENRVMEEVGTRQVVSSFFDGFSMMIYTGLEEKAHSWRYLLKKRDSRTSKKLYQDVLSLRTTGHVYDNYDSYSSYYRSSGRSGNNYYRSYRRNGGGLGGSYQFYFRTNL